MCGTWRSSSYSVVPYSVRRSARHAPEHGTRGPGRLTVVPCDVPIWLELVPSWLLHSNVTHRRRALYPDGLKHPHTPGFSSASGLDDLWLCRACELKQPGQPEPQCCLCPVAGGALKPTTLPGLWCHSACMQWIPEVTCKDPIR